MTTHAAASWLPLSPGERAVAIEVLVRGPLSRSEIARRLNLSAGSVTRLTKPLIESGLLIEAAESGEGEGAEVRQGRPSRPLDVVAESRSFIGFKITEDMVYGVVTTLRSDIVARHDRPLVTHDPAEVADLLAEMADGFARAFPGPAAIGIGVGGRVEKRSVVVESAFLGWTDVPLAELVGLRTGLPVVVENDVAALVEAESWFGAGRGLDRFAVLTIGAGIGYGLVLGGSRVASAEDGRGAARRWLVNPYGPLTPEGERGSAISLLGIPSIRYQVRAAIGEDLTYEEILARAAAGDPCRPASSTRRPAPWAPSWRRSPTSPCRRRSCSPERGRTRRRGGHGRGGDDPHTPPPTGRSGQSGDEGLRLPRLGARGRGAGHPGAGARCGGGTVSRCEG